MSRLVFEEEQKFNQIWLIALLLIVLAIMIRMAVRIIDSGPLDAGGILVVLITILPTTGILLLLFVVKLKTRIDENGIQAVFYPFGVSKNEFQWSEIENLEVMNYSPLKEYGGWGYRIARKGKRAMNVKGKVGIQIKLKSGKQFLIGTQRPDDAKKIISTYLMNEN